MDHEATVTPSLDLAGLARMVVDRYAADRVAILTAVTTGSRAKKAMMFPGVSTLLSLQYTDPEIFRSPDVSPPSRPVHSTSLRDIVDVIDVHGLAGTFDVVVVDPHHSYRGSVLGLAAAVSLARVGGLVLVHDCLPPVSLVSLTFVVGRWCGLTFAAFRHVCEGSGHGWLTIDADFGLGVIHVREHADHSHSFEPDDLGEVVTRYRTDPYRGMRAVHAADAGTSIELLRSREPIEHLIIRASGGGPGPLDPGLAPPQSQTVAARRWRLWHRERT